SRGLTWHSPDDVKNLCHVCGRHGCSPSQCSPRPAKKTSTQLDKLYSRFKAGPQRGRTSDPSRRSSSRSRSRSRNTRPNTQKTGPNNNGTRQSGSRPPASTSSSKPVQSRDQLSQPIGRPIVTSPAHQAGSGSLSRLDYIWISPFFPIPHLWSSVSDLTDVISTDHFLIVAHFDFLELKDHHAPSYLKQRQRCRTSYDFHSASSVQKESFASTVSALLPAISSLSRGIPLNQLWHQFKSSLLSASRSHFPRVNISLSRPKDIPHELRPYTRLSNSLTHFVISLKKMTTISQLRLAWSRFFVDFKPGFLRLFSDQMCLLNSLPDPVNLDEIFIATSLSLDEFRAQLQTSLRKLKQFLSVRITLEFEKFKTASMKSAVAERNENFYENKGKFITSSLNKERRCIVLDRVLVVDLPESPKLLVAPEEIKAAAITHFQNVVGPSISPFDSLTSLPPRWKRRYAPLEQFQESLYDPVMAPISVSELHEVISLSPAHKAPGPSSIPYEWFKVLPETALDFLCELMN
ncbi:hypothetical protein RhiirA4_432288, partial [Rhizophagus irregularis]